MCVCVCVCVTRVCAIITVLQGEPGAQAREEAELRQCSQAPGVEGSDEVRVARGGERTIPRRLCMPTLGER
jgi:hypothetical protein